MHAAARRFPAEWETQDGVLLAWPHEGTDWAPWLTAVEQSYVALVAAIGRHSKVYLIVPDQSLRRRAEQLLGEWSRHVHWLQAPYHDTWLRDSGPITLWQGNRPLWLDFQFTGWGGKFSANTDDELVARLAALPEFSHVVRERVAFALEGGAIESDGRGTLLSTWRCLQQRHPGKAQGDIAALMSEVLASPHALFLESGELEGDDTDAHIDTLARLTPNSGLVYQACDDSSDPHFDGLQAMQRELESLRGADGKPFRLTALPWAGEVRDSEGRRLAASYANFLITNGAILMPGYGQASDERARAALAAACPGYVVEVVPCRPLIEQNGSLHCITMQLPKGCVQLAR
jgi:agmatine/peptidylarginine deiminase